MSDDEGRIDFVILDFLQQRPHVTLHVGLSHLEGDALVHGWAERKFVHEADVNAGNRDGPALAAAEDYFAQHVGAISAQECRLLSTIHQGIYAAANVRFGSNSINAAVWAAAVGHLHQAVID